MIFQGIQQNIGPISLSTAYEDTGIPLDSLSDFDAADRRADHHRATRSTTPRRIVDLDCSETASGGR